MLFEIDADLLYTRPCLAVDGKKKLAAEENLQIQPPTPLKFEINAYIIAAFIDKAIDIDALFEEEKLGPLLAYNYTKYFDGMDKDHVVSKFDGLSFSVLFDEDLWSECDIEHDWETFLTDFSEGEGLTLDRDQVSRYGHELAEGQTIWSEAKYSCYFEDRIPSFEEYKKVYIRGRYGMVDSTWLKAYSPESVKHSLNHFSDIGGYASGAYYPADYVFSGFLDIRSIKLLDSRSKELRPISLDELKTLARKETIDNFDITATELLELNESTQSETPINWRKEKVENAQNIFDNGRKSTRKFYLFLLAVTGLLVWLFIG